MKAGYIKSQKYGTRERGRHVGLSLRTIQRPGALYTGWNVRAVRSKGTAEQVMEAAARMKGGIRLTCQAVNRAGGAGKTRCGFQEPETPR